MNIVVNNELPDRSDVLQLLRSSDAYMAKLYPSESNHLLQLDDLMKPNVVFLVARLGGKALGCGAMVIDSVEYAELKRMYVDESWRGKGIGKLLLANLIRQAKELEVCFLRLETGVAQPEAIDLYKAYGFYEIGPFGDYKHDPLSLFMEKRLE